MPGTVTVQLDHRTVRLELPDASGARWERDGTLTITDVRGEPVGSFAPACVKRLAELQGD